MGVGVVGGEVGVGVGVVGGEVGVGVGVVGGEVGEGVSVAPLVKVEEGEGREERTERLRMQ